MCTPNPHTDRPLPALILLDGGLGTTLTSHHNILFTAQTPLWSSHLLLASPSTLLACQRSFARACADVLLSASYQCSFEGFARSAVAPQDVEGLMRSAVGIARQALDDEGGRGGKVALSLGAYGACMVPSQEYGGRYDAAHRSQAQLREWHLRRLRVFQREEACWGSVDFVAFETLPVLEEVGAVREVMGDVSLPLDDGRAESGPAVEKEFWISCVFPGEGNCLPDGSSVADVVAAMLGRKEGARRPMGVGINCTRITKIESLVLEFENSIQGMVGRGELGEEEWPALVVYPDGTKGEVYNTVSKEWEVVGNGDGEAWADSMSWDEMLMGVVERARQRGGWKSILVGGCCKSTPEDIANLRIRIDSSSLGISK